MDNPATVHVPVMLAEVIEWLNPRPGNVLVDGTLGGGGHTRAMAQRVAPAGFVLAMDRDPAAIRAAERSLAGMNVKLVQASFRELPAILTQIGVRAINGIVLDLGLSSDQLADAGRGFSFDAPGQLDLRFDTTTGQPAWQLIEKLSERQLADLIYSLGEERHSRKIARNIVAARSAGPVRTAGQLADIVRKSVPRTRDSQRIDPATRTFQALRIAVNEELDALRETLALLPRWLAPQGRIAVISFHSLEDRIVKEAFRDTPELEVLTRKPLRPSDAEIARNPRSRSAKMRVARAR